MTEQWHMPCVTSVMNHALSCDLLCASESFHLGMVLVHYLCAQMPNELNWLGFRDLSSYFGYKMGAFTFKYCDWNVIHNRCSVLVVKKPLKLKK